MGALGLYCDLLSMPGILKPEHRHYAEEVRLLGVRSGAMIQKLMERRAQASAASSECICHSTRSRPAGASMRLAGSDGVGQSENEVPPVSLRAIVERSSGWLRRVGGGRAIEIHYGAAASVPVRVPEEAVERILVNLVRNAATALDRRGSAPDAGDSVRESDVAVCDTIGEPVADVARATIRIGVGMLVNRVGDPKPWPFRRVRLTVEDSGCGMTAEQLERLVCGSRAPSRGSHGIGFHVVRELAAASEGDLRVMSEPGAGTRVQIEWPIAGAFSQSMRGNESSDRAERRQSC
jgi:signal transduction histidine kinase